MATRKSRKARSAALATPAVRTIPGSDMPDTRTIPVNPRQRFDVAVPAHYSLPKRVAFLLDAIASSHPYQGVSYSEVFRMEQLLSKPKKLSDREFDTIYGRCLAAARYLRTEYGRDLIRCGADGVRATVNSQDVVENVGLPRISRVVASVKSAKAADDIINSRELQGPFGKWWANAARPLVAQMQDMSVKVFDKGAEIKGSLALPESTDAAPSRAASSEDKSDDE